MNSSYFFLFLLSNVAQVHDALEERRSLEAASKTHGVICRFIAQDIMPHARAG